MERINNKAAFASLKDRAANGYHVDSRLLTEVQNGSLYSLTVHEPELLLSFIWQESDPSRFLTPPHEPRTLRDVAGRFIQGGYTFADCVTDLGMPPHLHHPVWFQKCLEIERKFSYDDFGPIALVPANDGERKQSPEGTFYIYDGIHKTFVLSVLYLRGQIGFKTLQAFILFPRRE
jgi:hypothetical protein